MDNDKKIYVFADFAPYFGKSVGVIYVQRTRGNEFYSFEYDKEWLRESPIMFDPDLQAYSGRQYLNDDKKIFGMFADSCPDRWGRRLMNRREELRAKSMSEKPKKLLESDYLLGVYDEARMGGLRFKTEPDGEFLSNDKEFATPPWTSLRELEAASLAFESDKAEDKWLKQLLAPGSSLGGARPKASVIAPDGSLWIAKFPSKHDDFNTGAWEMVAHDLAKLCGINVAEAKAEKFSDLGTTFLTKRFDRDGNRRIHFSSAMTLLGKTDGANAADGSSYLEIVSFIKANGARPSEDIKELWKRIVFGIIISNTDDHLRNHGFILDGSGWRLSPMYDVNPDPYGEYLSLNIDEESSDLDIELAIENSPLYGIKKEEAQNIAEDFLQIVDKNAEKLAKKYHISNSEIERMSPAFLKR